MTTSYHHGDLRAALIAETLTMVKEERVHEIGFRELARRLKVSRSAPYRHFSSVGDLLVHIVAEGYHMFIQDLEAPLFDQDQKDPAQIVCDLGVAYVNFALENPSHYRLMFEEKLIQTEESGALVRELSKKAFQILRQAISRCVLDDPNHELYFSSLAWSCVHGISSLMIDKKLEHICDKEEYVRFSCTQLLKTLRCAKSS